MGAAQPGRHFTTLGIAVAVACAAAALVLASAPRGATASESLSNPGFESWTATAPAGWLFNGATFSKAPGEGNPGNAVRMVVAGGTPMLTSQAVEVSPGSELRGSIQASGTSGGTVAIRFLFLNDEFAPMPPANGSPSVTGTGYDLIELTVTAPAGAAYVQFVVVFGSVNATILVDNASLTITVPPPTATPTATPTITPSPTPADDSTPTPAADTPTPPPGSTPTATAADGNPATPTRTHTPTRTPTGTRTPSPTNQPTATKTPTPASGGGAAIKTATALATSTPTVKPGSGFGGLLANGDFEIISDGKPSYWEKFGGTMLAEGNAARGTYTGCLASDTSSTKWLYQVVKVSGGEWYAANAYGRLSGSGEASIRISWYTSSDGSGSQMEQAEGNISSSNAWTELSTGPVQAPDGANSARVRLVLRPEGAVTACFDDASFGKVDPPAEPPTAVPPSAAAAAPTQPGVAKPSSTATTKPGGGNAPLAIQPVQSFPVGEPGALRISEVMSDPEPAGRDAAFEWVELVNFSTEAVDLTGWRFGDSTETQILPALSVPPGGYVVIAGASADLPASALMVRSVGGEIGNGLGNTGDHLILIAPNGQIADEISYGDNTKVFDPAPPAPEKAATIGLRDPGADPASENWDVTLRPTPGEANLFPAKASSTVAGVTTAGPAAAAEPGDSKFDDDPGGGGGTGAQWMLLMGAAGLSAGVVGMKFGPRLKALARKP